MLADSVMDLVLTHRARLAIGSCKSGWLAPVGGRGHIIKKRESEREREREREGERETAPGLRLD